MHNLILTWICHKCCNSVDSHFISIHPSVCLSVQCAGEECGTFLKNRVFCSPVNLNIVFTSLNFPRLELIFHFK